MRMSALGSEASAFGRGAGDVIRGGDGDVLAGGSGGDVALGSPGKDSISGGFGNDSLNGGPGGGSGHAGFGDDNVVVAFSGAARDQVDCAPTSDRGVADRGDRLKDCKVVEYDSPSPPAPRKDTSVCE